MRLNFANRGHDIVPKAWMSRMRHVLGMSILISHCLISRTAGEVDLCADTEDEEERGQAKEDESGFLFRLRLFECFGRWSGSDGCHRAEDFNSADSHADSSLSGHDCLNSGGSEQRRYRNNGCLQVRPCGRLCDAIEKDECKEESRKRMDVGADRQSKGE